MTNNDLYDFGLRIVRLIENDDLYVKALIVKDAEIERLREALKLIGDGNTCMGLMTHPPICKRAYDARAALKEGE